MERTTDALGEEVGKAKAYLETRRELTALPDGENRPGALPSS
jgi:hypothetical protein